MFTRWFAIPFWQRVLGAFIAGALIGVFASDFAVQLKPLGTLFINAIMMLVAPLIFVPLLPPLPICKTPSAWGAWVLKP